MKTNSRRRPAAAMLRSACLLLLTAHFLPWVTANKPPQFVLSAGQSEIVLRLREGKETPVGSLIHTLKGFDYDSDPLTFGLRGQVANELLRIENLGTDEAHIYLKKELDRELEEEYMLVLTLTDGRLVEGSFVTQSLLILVEDINDNTPRCTTANSTVKVPENSEVPRTLTTIECTDADEGPYGQVIYKLETEAGDEDVFGVSTQNGRGILRLLQPLDYDRKFLYQLRVLAVDRANTGQINTATNAILVEVEDESDRPPLWLTVPPVTRIREDVPKGTFVLQVRAIDGDRGVNNPIAYSLLNEKELFGVDSQSGIVYTKAALDREDEKGGSYILQLSATEQTNSNNRLTVNTEVTILLLDVNDEAPNFKSMSYIGEVVENSPADVPITFLGDSIPECYDHDLGVNGTFRLYTKGDGGVFEVTPSQGINQVSFLIRVKNPSRLDYERLKVINFTLVAEEVSGGKSTTVPITIFIRDANDNTIQFEKDVYQVTMNENSPPGTTVARIRAEDQDSGIYGTEGIRYTSITGSIANELNLDSLTGVITVKALKEGKSALDRELASMYYLTVEARDNNGRGNRNTVQVQLTLKDLNDNAPIPYLARYEGRIFENELEFIAPLACKAKDDDLPNTPNSEINYSIVAGNEEGHFGIDKTSGQVRVVRTIDFEKLPIIRQHPQSNVKKMNFTVRANDLGSPPLFTLIPVTVWVLDANDFRPAFSVLTYNKIIREDTPPGTEIVKVNAYDGDASLPFNRVFYRIERGAQDKFLVDADTGSVRLAPGAVLDYNVHPAHILEIAAVDGGGLSSETATLINITVIDTNNKPPRITGLATTHRSDDEEPEQTSGVYHAQVQENSPPGTYITQVLASDPDHKPVLRYRIAFNKSEARDENGRLVKSMDLSKLFAIQSNDGVLKVGSGRLDREALERVKLHVEVEDVGSENGRQVASATLLLTVTDEQDNEPVFRKAAYFAALPENPKAGATVLTVLADDADMDKSIRYSLLPKIDDPLRLSFPFEIEPESGVIRVSAGAKVDRELRDWINFTVMAEDSGLDSKKKIGQAQVSVHILDLNDNSPVFDSGTESLNVREDTALGTIIGSVSATDADAGQNGKVTYVLDLKSSMGKFSIDAESGEIRVSGPLDREQLASYTLVVQAWDNWYGYATPESRNAFKQVAVRVEDVNDNPPEFEGESEFMVTEFHEGPIGTVMAKDADSSELPNGWVSFRIRGGNELNLFKLEQGKNAAKLVPARSLKGFYGNYTLAIEAQDGGKPPLIATKDFNVAVTDFNDNKPRFLTPQNLTIRVPENATIGTTMLQVRAIDGDTGVNGMVRYRFRQDLSGHWEAFHIDATTGVISLAKALDRQIQKIYHIRVEAYDLGPIPLSSDLDFTVQVQSVDDFLPRFAVSSVTVNFTENGAPGKERFRLPATIEPEDEGTAKDQTICYFILPSNHSRLFALHPSDHYLSTTATLDREQRDNYTLTVVATQDCLGQNLPGNAASHLKIHIWINDLNDSPPRFEKKVFTGGVSTSSDFGSEVVELVATDADAVGPNSRLSYYLIPPITMALTEGLAHLISNQNELFTVDRYSGVLLLNFDPQPDMKGFFTIEVGVNDTFGLSDRAQVLVSLLREDQKIKVVVRRTPGDVRQTVDRFVRTLGRITGSVVNVDRGSFRFHENADGSVDKTKSDFFIHFVHPETNVVLEVSDALQLLDQNIEELDGVFKEFNVLDTQAVSLLLSNPRTEGKSLFLAYASGAALFLAVLLFVVVSLCFAQRAKYQRQLKAATAPHFGSNSTMVPRSSNLPNTNVHSETNPNPIWMQAYHNTWYKEDSLSDNSESRDSLEEGGPESSPPSSHMRSFMGSEAGRRKDGSRTFHKNLIYNSRLDTNSSCLILKKHLETTEL